MGAGAAIGTAAAGVASTAIGAALQSDEKNPSIVKLPPELENQQLELISQAINDAKNERERSFAIANALEERARAQQAVAQGLIPRAEALATITRQNEELAQRFGVELGRTLDQLSGDTLGALDYGVEKDIRSKIQTELGQDLQEYKDPTVERELEDGRRRLEEQLIQQLGPGYATSDQGRRAMQMFDQSATELRARTSRDFRMENAQRLGIFSQVAGQTKASQLAGRGSILQTGELLFRGRETTQDRLNAGIYAENPALANLSAAAEMGVNAAQIGKIPFSLLQQFGQQDISSDTWNGIKEGNFAGLGFGNYETPTERRQRYVTEQGSALTSALNANRSATSIPTGYTRGGDVGVYNAITNEQSFIDPTTGKRRQRLPGQLW